MIKVKPEERKLDDFETSFGNDLAKVIEELVQFKKGEYWKKPFRADPNSQNTISMMKYIDRLRDEGLDINHGDSEFGYKMPLPESGANTRYLHIFRRR